MIKNRVRNPDTLTEIDLGNARAQKGLFKTPAGQIPIEVNIHFVNSVGEVVTNGVLPDELKDKKFPYFVFNSYDKEGAFKQSLKTVPPTGGWKFLKSDIAGNQTFLLFTGFNNIQQKYTNGDQLFIYTDDYINPNYFAYVVVSSKSVSLSSFTEYLPDLTVDGFYFGSDNVQNYDEPIALILLDTFGNPKTDYYTPLSDLSPYNKTQQNVYSKIGFKLDPRNGLGGYILADTNTISLNLKLIK